MTIATLTEQDRSACIDYIQSFLDPVEGGSGRPIVQDVCAPLLNSFSGVEDQSRLVKFFNEVGTFIVYEPAFQGVPNALRMLALHLAIDSHKVSQSASYVLQSSATLAYSMAVSSSRQEPCGGMKPESVAPLKQVAVRLLDRIESSPNRQVLSCCLESLDLQTKLYALNVATQTKAAPLPEIAPGFYNNLLASACQAISRIAIARAQRPNFSTLHF